MDSDKSLRPRPSAAKQVEGLALFAAPAPSSPPERLSRLPAPSVAVETSEDAADSLTPETLGTLRHQVLTFIVSRGLGGATTDEIEASLEGRHQTISPRVNELATLGYIARCDGKEGRLSMKRATRSGREAYVYVATEKGRALVR